MNNPELEDMIDLITQEADYKSIESLCSKITTLKYSTIQQKCNSLFFVSNIYHKTLNNSYEAQKILLNLLKENLNDKQKVEAYGRLAFYNLFAQTNKLKDAKKFHKQALQIIQTTAQKQMKTLIYILFWVYCDFKNPSTHNPFSNFLHGYVCDQKSNQSQAAIHFRKVLKHELPNIDTDFIKWKIKKLQGNDEYSHQRAEYYNLDKTFSQIYEQFTKIQQNNVQKEINLEKKKYLAYLKRISNKYLGYKNFEDQLDFLQNQIQHLQTDTLPISMYRLLNFPEDIVISRSKSPVSSSQLPKKSNNRIDILQSNSYESQISPRKIDSLHYSSNYHEPRPENVFVGQQPIMSQKDRIPLQAYNPFFKQGSYNQPHSNWKGSNLVKLNYSSDGQKVMFFYFEDLSKKRLYYCETNTKPDPKFDSHYDISSITGIYQGKMTRAFQRKSSQRYSKQLCFSVILSNKTRDFVALTTDDYNNWLFTLKRLLPNNNSLNVSRLKNQGAQSTTSFLNKKNSLASVSMIRK